MGALAVNCALGFWAVVVAGMDLRTRRVPNVLLLVMLLPTLVMLAWQGQGPLGQGLVHSSLGLLIASAPLMPGYLLGHLGAGDVKFVALVGFWLGGSRALEMLLVGSVLLGFASALALRQASFSGRQTRPRRLPATPAYAAAFLLQLALGPLLA